MIGAALPVKMQRGAAAKSVSNLLPNIAQIILDKIAVLDEQERGRGGSRFDDRESLPGLAIASPLVVVPRLRDEIGWRRRARLQLNTSATDQHHGI
jgi:hypothetical protein